jgi:hypothetical protein
MTAEEHDALIQSLADLQRQIGDKTREFATRGEFAELRDAFLYDLKARQAAIRGRIDAALRQGFSWRLIRTEFERDFDGIFGELLRWEKRLDAATIVRNSAGRSSA